MDELYVAEATALGARIGEVATSDGRLDVQLSRPASMGGDDGPGDFTLAVDLVLDAPGLAEDTARALMEATHRVCPYSRATMGNIEVRLLTAGAQAGSA